MSVTNNNSIQVKITTFPPDSANEGKYNIEFLEEVYEVKIYKTSFEYLPSQSMQKISKEQFIEYLTDSFKKILKQENESFEYEHILKIENITIAFDFNFLEIIDKALENIKTQKVTLLKQYFNAKDKEIKLFNIGFSFDKTTFSTYPSFDILHCHKLSFKDTTFKKGARIRSVIINHLIYEPRFIGADVNFANGGYAVVEDNEFWKEGIGLINKFQFRHQLGGDAKTYFIGMIFKEEANFTNSILDNVVFWDTDLSNCRFLHSKLDEAKFYNCRFPYQKDYIIDPSGKEKIILLLILISTIVIWTIFSHMQSFESKIGEFFQAFIGVLAILLSLFSIASFNRLVMIQYISKLVIFFLSRKTRFSPLNPEFYYHISILDEKKFFEYKDQIKNENKQYAILQNIREVYKELKINFEKNADYQLGGEFFYSQRLLELSTNFKMLDGFHQVIMYIHHFVNGFGERPMRALVSFLICSFFIFPFLTKPNIDYISTHNTPEFLLKVYNSKTPILSFDLNSTISEYNSSTEFDKDFLCIAKTTYKYNELKSGNDKNVNAFDNRFDYHFTRQYIPILSDNYTTEIIFSLSHIITPFASEEKKWFLEKTNHASFFGFIETFFLWIFMGAFLLSIKNRIKR